MNKKLLNIMPNSSLYAGIKEHFKKNKKEEVSSINYILLNYLECCEVIQLWQ